MNRLRGLIAASVRLVDALRPVVGALDLAGLSWRRLRAFQRGASCLADCGEGHTYGPWCQLGWPLPGPTWLITELADATMPLPVGAHRLSEEITRAIHASLTQVGTSWLEALEQVEPTEGPVPTPVDTEPTEGDRPAGCQAAVCFGMECMTECTSSHRFQRYATQELKVEEIEVEQAELNRLAEHLAEHPAVDSVHLIHHPACASLPDVEGKAGPCDCQGWSDVVQEPEQ